MPDTFNTIEEARAEIVRLTEQLTERTNERDTLTKNNEQMKKELDDVRALNQTYFNKLTAQYTQQDGDDQSDDKPEPTCEEFAKTLKL